MCVQESKTDLISGDDPIQYIQHILNLKAKNQQVQHLINNNSQAVESSPCVAQQATPQVSPDTSGEVHLDNRQADKYDIPLNRTVFVFRKFDGDLFKQVHFSLNQLKRTESTLESILGLTALNYFFKQQTVSLLKLDNEFG